MEILETLFAEPLITLITQIQLTFLKVFAFTENLIFLLQGEMGCGEILVLFTGGPRYMRSFYLRFRVYAIQK